MENDTILSAEAILRKLRDAGISQAVVARKLALPTSAVSNIFNGKRSLKLHEANIMLSMLPKAKGPRILPVIGMAGAGRWLEAIEETSQTITIPKEIDGEGQFAVEVVGDSMNMMLPEGSFAIVDTTDTRLFTGKIYLLRNGEGEATIKRYRGDPARFEPVSDNPEYQAFDLGSFDFKVIGRVTGGLQKF